MLSRMLWNFFLSAALAITAGFSCLADDTTMKKFETEGVVPDVLDHVPKHKLKVSYGSTTVNVGDTLTPRAAKEQPNVEFEAEHDSLYTLCMIDPDAPSRENPKFAQWLHWLVVNIPLNQVDRGEVFTEYNGPSPPKGTGPHRYVLVVFKQHCKVSKQNLPDNLASAVSSRKKFNTKLLAKSLNLGDPVFGNFFLSANN